jgi:hypothetical protein
MVGRKITRARTAFALVLGVVAFGAITAPGSGAAGAPTYEMTTRDSGALSGRVFTATAGESDGESVVLYGGERPGDVPDKMFGDTWVYRPSTGWVARCGSTVAGATGACGPGTRSTGALASGPNGVVLFGGTEVGLDGAGGDGPPSDTWVWSNDTWTQVCGPGACGPAGRMFPGLGGNGEQVVLFGGLNEMGVLDDTWVFDGTTWTQTCGSGQPLACGAPGLIGAAIGWDGTQFVMFGGAPAGSGGISDPVDDTWTFDGTKWEQVCGTSMATPCGPTGRALATIAFQRQPSAAQQGALLVGGGSLFSGGAQHLERDAWFWHAETWTQLATPWPDTPTEFTDGGEPPLGSGPLLMLAAPQPSQCQVLLLGVDPVFTTDFGLEPQTYAAGWDLTGTGQPPGCVANPAATPGSVPVDDASGVPVAAPTDATAAEDSTASPSAIARTGRGSDRLAVIGGLAVVAGLGAIFGSRRAARGVVSP